MRAKPPTGSDNRLLRPTAFAQSRGEHCDPLHVPVRLVQDIEHLKAQTGIQRVAEFLASLCPAGPGPHTITLPYDKTLIAGRLGLQPESLSRAFAKLRKVGVQIHASHVVVNEVSKLKCLAISEGDEFGAALPASLNSDSSLEVSERREE